MKKIKITETQANLLSKLEEPKTIKITKEQYNRLFEANLGAEGVTKNFKKEFRHIKKELPNPKPKFESVNLNESVAVEFIEFAQHVLVFLKEILTDPSTAGLDPFWVKMGVTRGEMFGYMADAGIIGTVLYNGIQKYEVYKNNFKDKVKFLYYLFTGKRVDGKENVDEAGGFPAGAEHDSRAPYNEPKIDKTTPDKGTGDYKVVAMNNEIAILSNSTNDLFAFYYEGMDKKDFEDFASREKTLAGHEDGEPHFDYGDFEIDADTIQSYINNNISNIKLGSGFDDWFNGAQLVKIDNSLKKELLSFYGSDEKIVKVLSSVGESTGAASSGSFVAPLSTGTNSNATDIKTPEKEMKHIIGEIDADGTKNALTGLELGDSTHNYFKVNDIRKKTPTDKGIERAIVTLTQDGNLVDSHLLFQYNPKNDMSALLYNKDYEKLMDAFKAMPIIYHENLEKIVDNLKKQLSVTESTGAASSGAYVQPKILAKNKKNWKNNAEPTYPNGEIVDPTTDLNMDITENKKSGSILKEFSFKQSDKLHKLYDKNYDGRFDVNKLDEDKSVDGGKVTFDDCTLYNNNKEAQKGKCSVGAVDNVVKIKESKKKVKLIPEMALKLQHNKKNGTLVAISDDPNPKIASGETFKNKGLLSKSGFVWKDGKWTISDTKLDVAKSAISQANKVEYLIEKLEDLEEMIANASDVDNKSLIKAKIDQYITDLANATDEAAVSAEIRRYLTFFSKFHQYSFYNRMLIFIQKPNATRVASYKRWQETNRQVKKGAVGITIMVPIFDKVDATQPQEVDPIDNKKEAKGFRAGTVFDVSDTEPINAQGEVPPTPQWFGNNEPSEIADKLYGYLAEIASSMGISVTNTASKDGEKGYSAGDHINLSSDVLGAAKVSTMVHELAHELMHHREKSIYYMGDETKSNRELKELQAESVSYVVLKHYGLPVSHHTTYLALWKANKESILKNLEIISKVAQFIIDKIDKFAEATEEVPTDVNVAEKNI